MEEPENEEVEGGRVSISAVCEDCQVKLKIDDVDAKLKKTFLKRLEDVFSYRSVIKDAYFIDGICCKKR